MLVQLAESDAQILGCFPVMSQLRPHLQQADFIQQIRHQTKEGYKLAFLQKEEQTVAVAGFRIFTCLASGKSLYVDDLVVDELKRSSGYGQQLFQWLIQYAQNHQCQHLSLDSGVQRFAAHRFYLMQRLSITSHHFSMELY
ncbi:GCN5 family acetyltransferase [Scytonema hofmannii PCC 7110]|uniref:GCN5 family acetyltransferase n=1 Tax=Scytonema hofmannii PCC 7110 TaxID=128403 RepID=A0A139X2Y7_9CYAN|nr:GNAT family N-acetyltransferase [Scytonema hofmannii]KYC38982.1 GCN5 family acetyltransferase [Scytonema hofmannii PCC 7110]